jgi:hypothetical protein
MRRRADPPLGRALKTFSFSMLKGNMLFSILFCQSVANGSLPYDVGSDIFVNKRLFTFHIEYKPKE